MSYIGGHIIVLQTCNFKEEILTGSTSYVAANARKELFRLKLNSSAGCWFTVGAVLRLTEE